MDKVDLRLLDLLWQDGRQSLDELAQDLDVSIPTAGRRLDRLIKKRVVQVIGAVDPSKVGSPISVMLALELAPRKVRAAIRELGKNPAVLNVMRTLGRFNAFASLWMRSLDALTDFYQLELPQISGVKRIETFVLLKNAKSPYTAVVPGVVDSPYRDLIAILQKDGRYRNTTLASMLKVSPATVGRQLRNLVESKTIKIAGYPLSSPNEVRAALGIRTEPAKLKTVTETLAASRSVMWLRNATGRYDIFAMTVFKSNEELSNFLVRDVERLDGVEYHEMSLVVETNSFYEARFNEYWATRERDA